MFAKHRIQTLSALLVGVRNRREDILDEDLEGCHVCLRHSDYKHAGKYPGKE